MKRFDPDIARDVWVATMTEATDGQYVRFADVAPLVAALKLIATGDADPDVNVDAWRIGSEALAAWGGDE